jgi:hypothetical protein
VLLMMIVFWWCYVKKSTLHVLPCKLSDTCRIKSRVANKCKLAKYVLVLCIHKSFLRFSQCNVQLLSKGSNPCLRTYIMSQHIFHYHNICDTSADVPKINHSLF